jgi:hypothetical protein
MGFPARNTKEKSCKRFRSRIEAAVAADDNFIEEIDSQYVPLPTSFYFNEI